MLTFIPNETGELTGRGMFVLKNVRAPLPPNGPAKKREEGANSFVMAGKGRREGAVEEVFNGAGLCSKGSGECGAVAPCRHLAPKEAGDRTFDKKMKRCFQISAAKQAEIGVRPSTALKPVGTPQPVL